MVCEAGAGLVCTPEDPQSFAQAARDLYSMPTELRRIKGQARRQTYLKQYTRAVLVGVMKH
jgi:hypothetical protein